MLRILRCSTILLFAGVLFTSCTCINCLNEYSNLYKDFLFLESQLEPGKENIDDDTYIYISAFPIKHVKVLNETYTVFSLAEPFFSPGYRGVSTGYTEPSYSPGVPPIRYNYNTEGKASIKFKKSDSKFLLSSNIPISRNGFTFKSHLYYFPANLTTTYLTVGNDLLRVISPIIGKNTCQNDSVISNMPSTLFNNSKVKHSINKTPINKNKIQYSKKALIHKDSLLLQKNMCLDKFRYSFFGIPYLPPHLKSIECSAIFIIKSDYYFSSSDFYAPSYLPLEFSKKALCEFYNNILNTKHQDSFVISPSKINHFTRWLRASPYHTKAYQYYKGNRTPFFISRDKANLIQIKRNEKAIKLYNRAIELSPEWSDSKEKKEVVVSINTRVIENSALSNAPKHHNFKNFAFGIKLSAFSPMSKNKLGYIDPSTPILRIGTSIYYQFQPNFMCDLTWDLLEHGYNLENFDSPDGFNLINFSRASFNFYYQTPIRIQFWKFGTRLQVVLGFARLSEAIDIESNTFYGKGNAIDIGLNILPKVNFSSRSLDQIANLTIGYRYGRFGNFTTKGKLPEMKLVASDYITPVTLNPSGLFITLNINPISFYKD